MRGSWLIPLILASLAACGTADPPPGELIGGFHFVATLDTTQATGRCRFPGSPERLDFEGILSHDPATGELWLTTGTVKRTGTLDGAHFETRSPAAGPGVSRELRACSCKMNIAEIVEGDLLVAQDCLAEGTFAGDAQSCPATLPGGELSWSDCACIHGMVREEVEFPSGGACTCTVEGTVEPAPPTCEIVYTLSGTLL